MNILRTARKFIFVIAFISQYTSSFAQGQDTTHHVKKNIIKLNLSSITIYEKTFLFEYERIVGKNQSFSIQAGYLALPWETNSDSLRLADNLKTSGFATTIDYRFYLPRENKHPAPHGIYISPFMSFHHFDDERLFELERSSGPTEPLKLDSKIDLFSIGGSLGYQFLLGKRWVIDFLLFGPSVTYYHARIGLTGNLSEQELDENLQQILEALVNRFPMVGNLLDEQVTDFTGKSDFWDFGFRYSVHVGYRF